MRRATLVFCSLALARAASAQSQPADERFFMGTFLPLMIFFGVLIAVVAIVASIVSARRRALLWMPPPFDPTLGPGPVSFGNPGFNNLGPVGAPHIVSKKTTTTNSDGSVTVTVIEESSTSGPISLGTNGVVDPELLGGFANGALEQEILTEVREAFRHLNSRSDIQ